MGKSLIRDVSCGRGAAHPHPAAAITSLLPLLPLLSGWKLKLQPHSFLPSKSGVLVRVLVMPAHTQQHPARRAQVNRTLVSPCC